jgi:nucleoside-diphosphate-sugar epimerase
MSQKALVTGASGFIGFHLVRALRGRGVEVRCLVRSTSNVDLLRPLGVSLAIGDITEPDSLPAALEGVTSVYHLAGLTKAATTAHLMSVNEGGTRLLARACAAMETPPVLVQVSSLAAAGPSEDDRARAESRVPAPVSEYGRSKLAGERAAAEYATRVPLSIVRPPMVFGEHDRDIFEIYRLVARGIHLVPVRAQNRYALVHAADLALGLWQVAIKGERVADLSGFRDQPGRGVYYFADERMPTYAQLGTLVARALGRRRLLQIRMPGLLVRLAAGVFEAAARLRGRAPGIINLDKAQEGFAGSWTCVADKARDQLGWSPEPLPERLRQTGDWYRAHGWL